MVKSLPDIDGWWVATDGELGGIPLPAEALTDLALRLRQGTFRFGTDEGWIVMNRHAHPHTLDIVPARGPNRGRVVPAIVQVAGSSMRICCDLSGRHRPQEFTSPTGTRRFLATYRRVNRLPSLEASTVSPAKCPTCGFDTGLYLAPREQKDESTPIRCLACRAVAPTHQWFMRGAEDGRGVSPEFARAGLRASHHGRRPPRSDTRPSDSQ